MIKAVDLCKETLAKAQEQGRKSLEADALITYAEILLVQGNLGEALDCLEKL